MKKFLVALLAVTVVTVPFAAEAGRPSDVPRNGSDDGRIPLYALARANGLSTLADAVEIAGLVKTLNTGGPFTVFAPTNDAFAALPADLLADLLADPAALTEVLLYHVAAGELLAADVLGMTEIEMLNGQTVSVSTTNGPMVNDSNIVATDVLGRNGVVHVIDAVLVPSMEEAARAALSRSAADETKSFGDLKAGFDR